MSNTFGGYRRAGFSYNNSTALSTTYAKIALTADASNAPRSANVPPYCRIEDITFELSSLSGSPATITFYLARDAGGDYPLTPEGTSTIIVGATTSSLGGTAVVIGRDYMTTGAAPDVADTLYAIVKVSGGTTTAKIYLNWKA